MHDDFNKDPFEQDQETNYETNYETNNENENNFDDVNGSTFQYQKKETEESQQEIPRWQPYADDYQTPPSRQPKQKQKSSRRWIVPLVIVLAVMVAAISVGVAYGARQLSRMVNTAVTGTDNQTVQQQPQQDSAVLTTTDTEGTQNVSTSGGYVLTDVSDIVEDVMPSVVSITSRALVDTGGYWDYWDYFFGGGYGRNNNNNNNSQKEEVESGIGSGTIISQNSKELLILTSYHVVEGSSSLYVTFRDDKSVDGYIKSQSEEDDIAIVAVPLSDISEETMSAIKIATLSTADAQVGEGAIVIGNALGYGMSVTTGIISATNRQITVDGKTLTVLQTDAAINEGNSGGCVLNRNGAIIGISEAKISSSTVEGMCYAIPVSSNTALIQTLLNQEGGTQNAQNPNNDNNNQQGQGAYLGIRGRNVDSSLANSYGMPQGVYVAGTIEGSGAAEAGIMEGDIIVGMDNVSFTTMEELQEQLSRHNPGDKVSLIIMREVDGRYSQVKVDVTLSESIG